jgi:hypothetical protein
MDFAAPHWKQFKAGDLIAYSGIGIIPSMTKLANNSDLSSVTQILFKLKSK